METSHAVKREIHNLPPLTWPLFFLSASAKPSFASASSLTSSIPTSSNTAVHSLQVHAVLYRDLLNLLQREALLTIVAAPSKSSLAASPSKTTAKPNPCPAGGLCIRQKFLAGLTRHQRWNVSDTLDFQSI